jgi:hypothetical protein
MNQNEIKAPWHRNVRTFLRIAGPICLALGVILTAVAFIDFALAIARGPSGGDPPKLFLCAFVGMPLIFVGAVMCMLGYLGAASRFLVAEQAPVAKDTINYMAEGTKEGVKTTAKAIAEGIQEGLQPPVTQSPQPPQQEAPPKKAMGKDESKS